MLVVDDFERFRKVVFSILQQRPEYQIIGQASDGLEAVAKARSLHPDLVLLDLGLPKLNGIEAAKEIRRLVPHAKILFISQEPSPEIVQETLRSGGQGYVHKQRTANDLLPAIEAVLGGKKFVSSSLEFSQVTDVHSRRHEVLFCSDEAALIDGLSGFIAAALNAGSTAIALATKSRREHLIERLKKEGFDIDGAVQQGTYLALDSPEMLSAIMPNGEPDRVRFSEGLVGLIESVAKAARTEDPHVAICGECLGPLCAEGNMDAAIQFEKISSEVVKTHNVDILCAYFLSCLDGRALKNLRAVHTGVYSS